MTCDALKTLCFGTAAAALLFAFTGCRTLSAGADTEKPGNAPVTTITVPIYKEAGETLAPTTPDGIPVSGRLGDIKYEIVQVRVEGKIKKRGYIVDGDDGEKAYPYTILVSSGEFSTGGHSIEVTNLRFDGTTLTVYVLEKEPAPTDTVTQAITYPSCAVRISKLPKDMKVVSNDGKEFECLRYYDAATAVKEGWIAVLENGGGEIMMKTYVYLLEDGKYSYVHATSTTERWGSTRWKDVVSGSGVADSRKAVVEEAKKFGSAGFVLFAGDDKPHSISEFLADKK